MSAEMASAVSVAGSSASGHVASRTAAIATRPAQDRIDDARPRALIVDEETEVGAMLGEVLRADGYSCTVVESARKALALLDTQSFDVILSDLRMPEMNGYEVRHGTRDTAAGSRRADAVRDR